MDRKEIREKTMRIIYQMDLTGDFNYEHQSVVEEDQPVLCEKQAVDTLRAMRDHADEIDSVIAANLDKWKPERVARTDMAILRTAVCEMFYLDYVPESVSINEAVEMAKKYGDEKSYAFINSVLGRVSRNRSDE
jgi:N utilization substance protein B